jgi:scytalone dehydratase
MGELHEDITPDEYAAILSSPKLLGPKRLKCQHLLGGAKWEQQSDGSITVTHQIHVLHQLYTDESLSEVANKGHAHGTTQHGYRKIDGVWKLDVVVPKLNWFEHDLFGTLNPPEDENKSG